MKKWLRRVGPLLIAHTKRDPLVVAEIELGQIPLQMLLADVEIAAMNSALQNRIVILDSVGVRLAANIFAHAVSDRFVTGKLHADLDVPPRFVGHQKAGVVDLSNKDRL